MGRGRKAETTAEEITKRRFQGSKFQSTGGKTSIGWEEEPLFLSKEKEKKKECGRK